MKKLFITLFIICIIPAIFIHAENITNTDNENYSVKTIEKYGPDFGECYFAIDNDASLWSWGANFSDIQDGQLGTGTAADRKNPIKILNDVLSISYCCAIKNDNSLWVWGQDHAKAWGIENYYLPTEVEQDVIWADAGTGHTVYVKKDGTLWGYGYNSSGQLGDTSSENVSASVKIMDDVKKAVVGDYHTVILKNDGSVWTLGDNNDAQLGNGTESVYTDYEYWHNRGLSEDDFSVTPYKVMDNIKDIFAGETCSFAIDKNNTLWAWGNLEGIRIGGTPVLHFKPIKFAENVKDVLATQAPYILILKTDSSLWIYGLMGENEENAQLTVDGGKTIDLPFKIMDNAASVPDCKNVDWDTLILKNNGELYSLEFALYMGAESEGYTLTKVMNNIKVPGAPNSGTEKFIDISNKPEEMQEAINSLWTVGITEGTSENEFSPDKPITRAEIAALLLRMIHKDDGEDNGGFSDVTPDKWYYYTAGASKRENLIAGYEDNTFRGENTILKEEIVALAMRVLKEEKDLISTGDTTLPYADADDIPQWAKEDIKAALEAGIIENDRTFGAGEEMTRGDAAVILYRLYNLI